MSKKRCFELSAGPSFSAVSRALVIGGALSLAVACARKDAASSDSMAAASNSATTSTTAMASPSATPVESVSTGETSVSADSQKNPSTAGANGAADTSSRSSSSKTAATPTHRTVVHHAESTTTKRAAASPTHSSTSSPSTGNTAGTASSTASTSSSTSADTGQKTAADTSKKTASAGGGTDHLLVSPQEYEGWKMFSVYCYRCHGVDAMGGGIAPNLRHSVSSEGSVTHEVFIQTVTNGRLEKGMPSWKALLSPEQMEDLWQYINARSSGRLAPGRPHMAQGANP
jgi:cbb3-type cytochrome c oxidase subunit III